MLAMSWRTHLIWCTAVLSALTACNLALKSEPAKSQALLGPGREVERTIENADVHRYHADLTGGDYLDVVFEQRGVDVAVRVFEPSGELWFEIDSPTGDQGEERVELHAVQGRYLFEVVPFLKGAESGGGYTVRVVARRDASPRDRDRAKAAKLFADAKELHAEKSVSSRRRSLELYRQALALSDALGDRHARARLHYAIGRVHDLLGEKQEALDAYRKTVELLDEREDPERLMAPALTSSGALCRQLGDYDAAQEAYERALDIHRRRGFRKGEANVLNNLGRLSSARGAMHEAQRFYEEAVKLWRETGERSEEILTLTNLGGIHIALGDQDAALDHLSHARARLGPEVGPRRRADLLERLADVYTRTDRSSEAESHYHEALRLYQEQGERGREAYTLDSLGDLYLRIGDGPAAHESLLAALEIFADLGDERGQAIVSKNLGRLHEERGTYEEAERYLQTALTLTRKVNYLVGEAETLKVLAQVALERGDPLTSWLRIEQSLAVIEDLRQGAERLDYRTRFSAAKHDYYDFAVRVLMELDHHEPEVGYDVLAFELSERARARSLLDALPGTFRQDQAGPAWLERTRELEQDLNAAEQRRRELLSTGRNAAAVERQLRALLAALQKHRAEVRAAAGQPEELRPLGREEIRNRLLDSETLLIQYDLGPRQSYVWTLTSGAMTSYILPGRARIEAAARQVHQSHTASHRRLGREPARQAAAALSRMILAPLVELPSYRRILVAAEGALHYVPFGALPHPDHPDEPLVSRHEVVHLPSASVVAALRTMYRDRPPPPATLAVLADPVFRPEDGRVHDPARDSGIEPPEVVALERTLGVRLGRLPFSRREAEGILALVDPDKTLAALDFEANKELARSGALASYRLLHFATHGVIRTDYPELSGLVLSLVDERGRPRDGFLLAHEIRRLDLAADLVVLSACSTALGAEVRGEGMVGLTHAFLQAGASRVLVSLWNVDDEATAELNERFYRALFDRGLSPAAALREAQLSMRRNPRWSAPYFWAGFVLQGN